MDQKTIIQTEKFKYINFIIAILRNLTSFYSGCEAKNKLVLTETLTLYPDILGHY